MKTTCVIGIGSPSGDDQVGWLVVQALKTRLPPDISLYQLDRPGSTLVPLLENADRVILIDAMQSGDQAGQIHHFATDEWACYRSGLSSHGLGVFEALGLARELGALPARLELYGIEISATRPGSEPVDAIIAAAHRLADRIAAEWGG